MDKFFYSVSLDDLQSNVTTIQVLRSGDFHHRRYGNFTVTPAVMDSMIANFPGPDRVPLDFNHGSLDPNPDRSRAAGWVKRLFKQDNENTGQSALFAEVEFTDEAAGMVRNNQFRFISPEFTFNRVNPESGTQQGPTLLAAALTNRPFLPDMLPVTLSDSGWLIDSISDEEAETEIALYETSIETKVAKTVDSLSLQDSLMERVENVTRSFYRKYPDNQNLIYWVRDVREGNVIIERNSEGEKKFFEVNYAVTDSNVDFDNPEQWTEVQRSFIPVRQGDSPALQDQPSTSEGEEQMDKVLLKLLGLKEDAGEDVISEAVKALVDKSGRVDDLETQITELTERIDALSDETKLSDDEESVKLKEEKDALEAEEGDLEKRLTDVSEENVTLSQRLEKLEDDKRSREAEDRIEAALESRKLTPAEVDGNDAPMRKLALSDPDMFDSIIEAKPAYEGTMMKLVSSDGNSAEEEKSKSPEDDYWMKFNELADAEDNRDKSNDDIHDLVAGTYPELAKAAGLGG